MCENCAFIINCVSKTLQNEYVTSLGVIVYEEGAVLPGYTQYDMHHDSWECVLRQSVCSERSEIYMDYLSINHGPS